ncbi:MAG: hypothetical protein V7641_3659 [Blastocatellia bacterium]
MDKRLSEKIKQQRAPVAGAGFVIGLLFGLILSVVINRRVALNWLIYGGAAGTSLALLLGERMNEIPTQDDLRAAEFKEGMNPLGIGSPRTSKESKEESGP